MNPSAFSLHSFRALIAAGVLTCLLAACDQSTPPSLVSESITVPTTDQAEKLVTATTPTLSMHVAVDLRDIYRGLIHSTLSIPIQAQRDAQQSHCKLWFPKWIPGIHAPRGAIQNMAGLFCEDENGNTLAWHRDPHEPHAFFCALPPEPQTTITVRFDYLTNQSSTNSLGVDSFGDAAHGIVSWNNVIMYPDGYRDDHIQVHPKIRLPDGWQMATALVLHTVTPVASEDETKTESKTAAVSAADINTSDDDPWTHYAPCTLRHCIDSPLIAGKYFKTFQLSDAGKNVRLHCVGDSYNSIRAKPEFLRVMKNMIVQSRLLFGVEHYSAYDFLLVCSNSIPHIGLEHLSSSLNSVNGADLNFAAKGALRVMSHEYMHSWCGKYCRPQGMHTHDFHHPKDTTMLWVYEGLTQYLGKVVAARSEMNSAEDFQKMILSYTKNLRNTNGRQWRSLADTASASYLLRGGSAHWQQWMRHQDFYIEGALIWLEVDCLIRQRTEDSDTPRSLDTFVKKFLGTASFPSAHTHKNDNGVSKDKQTDIAAYSYDDLIQALNDTLPYDWTSFFETRVYRTQESFNLQFLQHSGWEIVTVNEHQAGMRARSAVYRTAYESIGLQMSSRGTIYHVLKGSPAYHAGLARGMQIDSINGRPASAAHLHLALQEAISAPAPHADDSAAANKTAIESGTETNTQAKTDSRLITLRVRDTTGTQTRTITYNGGPRYLYMQRIPNTSDRLHAITSTLVATAPLVTDTQHPAPTATDSAANRKQTAP